MRNMSLAPMRSQLGLSALQRSQPIKLIRATLAEIVRRTGWTTLLSVWSGQGPTIVDWERSHIPLVTALGLGSVLSVATSAQGRMFTAFLPRDLPAMLIARRAGAQRDRSGCVRGRARPGAARAARLF